MKRILFVCKSNVFRSPIGASILNRKLERKIADSAGTDKWKDKIFNEAIEASKKFRLQEKYFY